MQDTGLLYHVLKELLRKVCEATQYGPLQRQLLTASLMLLRILQSKAPCVVPVKVWY